MMERDEEKTAFNARAKASMLEHLKSKSWPEKVASIERMNEMGRAARESMRRARARAEAPSGIAAKDDGVSEKG